MKFQLTILLFLIRSSFEANLTKEIQFPNYCITRPCLNGGTCIPIKKLNAKPPFACVCKSNYIGLTCNVTTSKVNLFEDTNTKCANNPCLNGGVCIRQGLSFKCKCPHDFRGFLCQEPVRKTVDLCTPTTCMNRGLCVTQQLREDQFQVYCFCSAEFTGAQCQTSINATIISFYKNNCNKNGIVLNNTCKCFPNYYGRNCEYKYGSVTVNKMCPDKLCVHGICKTPLKQTDLFYCVCEPGWVGERCDIKNYCESSICQNGGTCQNNQNDYTCKCKPDYTGKNCQNNNTIEKKTYDSVVPSFKFKKCLNGGTADNEYDYSPCKCLPGFIGFKCEINVCIQPLLKGSCVDSVERYYYDPLVNKCIKFYYTGCQGNQNNFESSESCFYHCGIKAN